MLTVFLKKTHAERKGEINLFVSAGNISEMYLQRTVTSLTLTLRRIVRRLNMNLKTQPSPLSLCLHQSVNCVMFKHTPLSW